MRRLLGMRKKRHPKNNKWVEEKEVGLRRSASLSRQEFVMDEAEMQVPLNPVCCSLKAVYE